MLYPELAGLERGSARSHSSGDVRIVSPSRIYRNLVNTGERVLFTIYRCRKGQCRKSGDSLEVPKVGKPGPQTSPDLSQLRLFAGRQHSYGPSFTGTLRFD